MNTKNEKKALEKSDFTVAVVDDSELSRKTIVNILDQEGYNIVGEAETAEKAFHILHANKTKLIILDVVMPEISGLDIAKAVVEKFPETAIVMISSLTMEHIIIESISNGAVDFLPKPFNPDDLIASVEKVRMRSKEDM